MNAFQCDLTVDTLESHIPQCSVDIATLVFVLSAIHPDKMVAVLQNIIKVKNPLNSCSYCVSFISMCNFLLGVIFPKKGFGCF